MIDIPLIVTFTAVQVAYIATMLVDIFFLTRPVNWVEPTASEDLEPDKLADVVLVYPVLHEPEETMRTTLHALRSIDYPPERYRVVAVPNFDDTETIARLERLRQDLPFVEIMIVPPTSDPSWSVVWEAWEREGRAYWWHTGERAGVKALPPKKTRQLVYVFYNLVAQCGDDWLLDYIDADSVPPAQHFRQAAAGVREYDVLQSTNIAGNLLDSWAASWHALDHMTWDGNIYPHLSDNGRQPFWVLGKGLFYKAADLVRVGGFNPWVAIEDPEVGLRLWKDGKRLGVIADPLIEEVPVRIRRGITQRKRWICGFFQAAGRPLHEMGFTFWDRVRARLILVPCLSLVLNAVGIPLGIWALVTWLLAASPLPIDLVGLSFTSLGIFVGIYSYLFTTTWRRTALVLRTRGERLRYMLRISPPFVFVYWIVWIAPILIGVSMFLREGGLTWERTKKIDANHQLIRTMRTNQG